MMPFPELVERLMAETEAEIFGGEVEGHRQRIFCSRYHQFYQAHQEIIEEWEIWKRRMERWQQELLGSLKARDADVPGG